ncbi:MAG: cell wall metabolism sensor histidine kinase WalK [Lachnospiraceae bacterium]|nr:cell wall metabolism sensor histidine kinase WalK [Lachnospiraceae bacterium]
MSGQSGGLDITLPENLRTIWRKALRRTRSLRLRLFFVIFFVALIPCVIMRHALTSNYIEQAVSVRKSTVTNQMETIAAHLITYNYLEEGASEVIDAELAQISSLYDGRIIIVDPELTILRDTYDISTGKTMISEEVIRGLTEGTGFSQYDANNGYIEIVTPIKSQPTGSTVTESGEQTGVTVNGVMLTSVSTDTIVATRDRLNTQGIIVEALTIVIVLSLAIFLSGASTEPFRRLAGEMLNVRAGYSNEPIHINNTLETQQICDSFNTVLEREKVLDDSREEFVANVSHELKTPITSMKVLADSLLAQEDAPVEMYREFMGDIAGEIERENRIINDLLTLVRADRQAGTELEVRETDINKLTETVLKRLKPIAVKKDVELIFESVRSVSASVDEVKITQMITNLVENAIKYNKDHGWVRVVLDADHQNFFLSVSDSGVGIPEESLAHIYERFYRVDKSHSREIGGTGLGLALTRSAVIMHHGIIECSSKPGEGTTFTVTIPLIYRKI